ncbi:hypothetical protein [Autumnicola psychrophila]|uniref:DUF4198 domain-containing protein n=1 Tax=Autumnicola psychrophila TaxID=3075592 RepID=A0ABU3DQQ0_9FLAO|nr:hypothetical protein [Zunongwangia sp. F225]MDT0686032.1 hypothetical protein [Zunongwangia sp. F225]
MKTTRSTLLLFSFLFLNALIAHAHALVIDTEDRAVPGKEQEVKIYYSEFADGSIEKVVDWYSNVAEFQLYLVQPNGERVKLKTTAHEDHFTAAFTPEKEGAYRLEIAHTAEDPGDGTAYQFNAFANIWAGNSSGPLPVTKENPELSLVEEHQSKDSGVRTFKTYFKGEPKEGITATVFMPSGKKIEVKSNSEGVITFNLEEKGAHFIEATTYDENEAGQTEKAPYTATWRCATQKVEL